MTTLTWDNIGERTFETGVDRGVLFTPDESGEYTNGFAWNGLTGVTESPSGAEANKLYADNIQYLNLTSAELFAGTIEAYTYPDEFGPYDGLVSPAPGVVIGQQARRSFGFAYRTRFGNDVLGDEAGYKLHLVYGATAQPSERGYTTVNDNPEAITFSWSFETIPVAVLNARPTALLVINSTEVDPDDLAAFEVILYGAPGVDPRLPLPDEVIDHFGGAALTLATPTEPTEASNVITIPTITGVTYKINGDIVTGTYTMVADESVIVVASANVGYKFPEIIDTDWFFEYA